MIPQNTARSICFVAVKTHQFFIKILDTRIWTTKSPLNFGSHPNLNSVGGGLRSPSHFVAAVVVVDSEYSEY